ncbi:tyrosine-protein kinase receptor Tie-1-like [Branchiostoma floridae]|uniref:receptor protein-tyrosine kinase n=1 Tax=Branchiostoma floridae TaxID=7739 RepID=A0A9J7MZ92_BRAFL|nr:tyrosine-protein kinase receptor Tie-1-like [Branchiostoma floridae]
MCATPVNSKSEEFLFRVKLSIEAVQITGEVVHFTLTASKQTSGSWVNSTQPPWVIQTSNSDCNIRIVRYFTEPDIITVLNGLWGNYVRQLTCTGESKQPSISVTILNMKHESEYGLAELRKVVPRSVMENEDYNYFVWMEFGSLSSNEIQSYTCEVPPIKDPFSVYWSLIKGIEYVDIEVHPVGCPDGKYGLLCDKNCTCKNGARCHGFNGACKCPPGWKGTACDTPKKEVSVTTTPSDPREIYTSANVTFHCKAYNVDVESVSLKFPNGSEKSVSGEKVLTAAISNIQAQDNGTYTCLVKDTGGDIWNGTLEFEIVNCPPNRKGAQCTETCDCTQGASCDRWAGCVCPPGWKGIRCETQCPAGKYGKDCRKSCNCLNGANCNHGDGKCKCTAGWYGRNCSKPCSRGRFGWVCQYACTCKNNATCNNEDGSCTCVSPWTGRNCDKYEPLLESLLSTGSVVLLFAIVMAILYKTQILACSAPDTSEEDKILFELRRMEQDLAQSLQPGWLRRWEKKSGHLTPGPLIGEGMFGQVRRAKLRTPEGELDVAAKTVRVEDSQSYRDFYREAAILVAVHEQNGNVRASNIVRLLGLIAKSREKYILLEYAPKGDLLGFLRSVKNRDGEVLHGNLLKYAVHISRALQELERLKIVHRDVAARNVLIIADNVAKLTDFGLARDVYATTQYVKTNNHGVEEFLPLKWMALESIETGEYTCESDVWSFGVLLWEIATLGNDPCFDDKVHLTFLQMVGILRQGIRMKRPPGCPEDLYRLMRACWRDVPATRPTPDGLEERLLQLMGALFPDEAIDMETAF